MISELTAHIRKFSPLPADADAILADYIELRTFRKKEMLLRAGHVCNANYFIVKGLCRSFQLSEKDTEIINHFAIENWWITDYFSLESRKPSEFSIQAIEDTQCAVLYRERQDELFDTLPQFERYFRIISQRALAAALQRVMYIFGNTGEERYEHFRASFPEFVQRVPQYMLASYLGLTPEFISKIRAKRNA
ncbi:Crp/Fnr family transcriptional regulator [Chitinophaga caseinilytica]|uniref:Crp/Fnr family transcriptional regulator n=1 Tax=Chitinophaga caseinilytica TaxID=2267521 RepID=A0ABZ2Z795_9BACT